MKEIFGLPIALARTIAELLPKGSFERAKLRVLAAIELMAQTSARDCEAAETFAQGRSGILVHALSSRAARVYC